MPAPALIIYSHPARQADCSQRPYRAFQEGAQVLFLNGLYYKPDRFPYNIASRLPGAAGRKLRARLQIRRLTGFPDDRVVSVSGIWPEALFRPLESYKCWNVVHDWYASRWLSRFSRRGSVRGPIIFHGFQGACRRSLAAAKRAGMVTAVEITQPFPAISVIAEERRRLGLPVAMTSPPAHEVAEVAAADFVIVPSRWSATGLREINPDVRILCVPMGADVEGFNVPPSKPLGFNAIFVGQLCIRKGLHHLLQAWSELSLPGAKLWLLGLPTDELGREIARKSIPGVEQFDFQRDARLVDLYQRAHIFVGPTLSDAGFNAVHEAAASGLPCVVSDRASDLVRDGIEGFVIPAGDIAALKSRITTLYADSELRTRMGIAARRRAEQFSWDSYGARLLSAYREMLAPNGNAVLAGGIPG